MEHYTNSCDACGASFIHDGLTIDISGHYNGFTDHCDHLPFRLCHDCVVRMIEVFPAMADKLGKGCHPCESEMPCCAFAWKTVDDVCSVPSDDLQSWVPYLR